MTEQTASSTDSANQALPSKVKLLSRTKEHLQPVFTETEQARIDALDPIDREKVLLFAKEAMVLVEGQRVVDEARALIASEDVITEAFRADLRRLAGELGSDALQAVPPSLLVYVPIQESQAS